MRTLLITIFVASVLLTWVSLLYLPPEVAIHFGADGVPDSWGTRESHALVFLTIDLGMFLIFLFLPSLMLRLPKQMISLPNKEYWLAEDNLPEFRSIFEGLSWDYGVSVLIFLLLTEALTIDANLSSPVQLNMGVFWFVFIAFLSYTAYWCVKMYRTFAVPKGTLLNGMVESGRRDGGR